MNDQASNWMNAWYHNIWMKREYDNTYYLIIFCLNIIWLFVINNFKISIIYACIVCVACIIYVIYIICFSWFFCFSFLFFFLLLSALLSWLIIFLLLFSYFMYFVFLNSAKITALWLYYHIWSSCAQ